MRRIRKILWAPLALGAMVVMSACGSDDQTPQYTSPGTGGSGGSDGTGATGGTGGTSATGGTSGTGGTGGACTPTTCAAEGAQCGTISDGCDGTLECGTCTSPDTCGDDNTCSCTPTTCSAEGANCGTIDDGCEATLDCGECTEPEICGGGGTANVCGEGPCVPTTCDSAGANCGTISDGCSATLDCGQCTAPDTCGGGGVDNVCGCAPTTCAAESANCGTISDGCGGELDCGQCTEPETCGGGGVDNVCGCAATSCAAESADCGTISDGCGTTLTCGSCTAPEICGGGGVANQCETPANWPSAGDLVITELLYNPINNPEDKYEWIEVYNPSTTVTYNLAGCVLSESTRSHSIGANLEVAPGAFVTLASGPTPEFTPDYVHNRDVFLVNSSSGSMTLTCGTTVIDKVDYEVSGGWPPSVNGSAIALDPTQYDATSNDDGANWCLADSAYGTSGNLGTPGATNESCGCTPLTSCPSPMDCGTVPDGCGGVLSCGTCTDPETCGGGGTDNVCGQGTCVPTTCQVAGANCGTISNGCGGLLDCGTCAAPQTCGGGGTDNVCGCTPTSCSEEGAQCGSIDDGCGNTLFCGACTAPQTCGGGGIANICGCTATTCEAEGADCGTISNGCGGTLTCGTCTAPETCGGGGVANQCGSAGGWPTEGGVVITELMYNPANSSENDYEWIEVFNPSATETFDLAGCVLSESTRAHTIGTSLPIAPGEFLTLASSATPGFTPDYVHDREVLLVNDANGSMTLTCGTTVIDTVDYGVTGPWPPSQNGAAIALAPLHYDATDNDDGANWCLAESAYGTDGNLGTPGLTNDSCGCTPITTCPSPLDCGTIDDTCGGTIDCGSCTAPDTCGGGGVDNVCGCTPMTACPTGLNCGTISDGCTATLDCGNCSAPFLCGGGGEDNVCGLPQPGLGDVIFTEVMQNPTTISDELGEWFEMYNTSSSTFSLKGCIMQDDGTDSHTLADDLVIAPGAYLTFARTAAPGFTPDYVYTGIILSNDDDELRLVCNSVTIDEVKYDNGLTFPDPDGMSMNLDPSAYDAVSNNDGTNWCVATANYNGDLGTPGAANTTCGSSVTYTIDWCRLQFPPSMISIQGDERTVYGRVFINGLTDQTTGTDTAPSVIGQVGYGADISDPVTWTNWSTATANPAWVDTAEPNNDEYMATLTVPAASADHYDYAFRFSGDGGVNWTYCDLDGSTNSYSTDQAGDLLSKSEHTVEWCRLQSPATIDEQEGTSVTVYGQVLVNGLTDLSLDGNDPHPLLVGEVGYGADATTPPTDWTWSAATENSGYNPTSSPNDEYMATLVVPASSGSPYDYAFRFSGDGGTTWTYCDLDGESYSTDQAGAMTSTPAPPPAVYFSEYVEGSSYNKAVEIFNGTASDFDLSGCDVRVYSNGSATPSYTIGLSGTLASSDVYVLCHGSSDADILAVCDQTSGSLSFNGDDAVELICNAVTLDVMGQIGLNPPPLWGAEQTLRRSCSVTTGDTDGSDAFDPSVEWASFPQDTFTDLGQYVCP